MCIICLSFGYFYEIKGTLYYNVSPGCSCITGLESHSAQHCFLCQMIIILSHNVHNYTYLWNIVLISPTVLRKGCEIS